MHPYIKSFKNYIIIAIYQCLLYTVINLPLTNIISPDLKTTLKLCVSPTLSVEENAYEMQAGYIVAVATFILLIIVIIGLLLLLIFVHVSRNKQIKRREVNIKALEKEIYSLKLEKKDLEKTKSKFEIKKTEVEEAQL